MSLSEIRDALINGYTAGTFGLKTAFENTNFKPDKTKPHASVFVVPAQPSVATLGLGGEDLHEGIFQINLYYPLYAGDTQILSKASQIQAYYSAGKTFSDNETAVVIKQCGRDTGRAENGMFRIILTVDWYARITR